MPFQRDGDMVGDFSTARACVRRDGVLSDDSVVICNIGREVWDTSGALSDIVSCSHLYRMVRVHGSKSCKYALTRSDELHPSPPQFLAET